MSSAFRSSSRSQIRYCAVILGDDERDANLCGCAFPKLPEERVQNRLGNENEEKTC